MTDCRNCREPNAARMIPEGWFSIIGELCHEKQKAFRREVEPLCNACANLLNLAVHATQQAERRVKDFEARYKSLKEDADG
jgi:hypothetical protein